MNFSGMICRLRSGAGISQEKLGEILGVSRQAVQKWESGAAMPDIENIVRLSKYFGISTDALLFDSDKRVTEELTLERHLSPQYSTLQTWEDYSSELPLELCQSLEEGKDIERYSGLFRETAKLTDADVRNRVADILFGVVLNAGTCQDYAYMEPSDLDTIRLSRPTSRPSLKKPDEDTLTDKIRGAWYGRIAGCLLGKPVEGMRTNELVPMLKLTGNYPMKRYIRADELEGGIADKFSFRLNGRAFIDRIPCAPVDDDTNYTVMAQLIIKRFGRDFTPWDVSRAWLDLQPKSAYCTAERVAFRNFVAGYNPPESALYKNPYREWIGAQIRGDYFGYINPADPETAADMAWRDASISHVKNGIYGEMLVAAMLAAASSTDDIKEIIAAGLGEIPEKCRLSESVRKIVSMFDSGKTEREVFAQIHAEWDEHTAHGWCHTIPNAMIVTASLLFGGDDFGKTICLAVQTGFDTDCNGATAGSINGMRLGYKKLPREWFEPLNDRLSTSIFGVGDADIPSLVAETVAHALGK